VREEQPGPPFNQRTTGSFSGSLRDSKNPRSQLTSTFKHNLRLSCLTVKQMLIILVIVQIAGVLLHTRIDTQGTGVHLLDPEIVRFKLAANLTFLLAIFPSDPDVLDIGTTDNMIPVRVRAAGVLLGEREEGDPVQRIREEARDLVPERSSLVRQRLQLFLEVMERLRQGLGGALVALLGELEDLLRRLGNGRGRCSDKERSRKDSHDEL